MKIVSFVTLLFLLLSICIFPTLVAKKQITPDLLRQRTKYSERFLDSTVDDTIKNYMDIPIKATNSDPFCYGHDPYVDNQSIVPTFESSVFSFIIQFVNRADSDSTDKYIFSVDNMLGDTSPNRVFLGCLRRAYVEGADIPLACRFYIGANSSLIEQNFTASVKQGKLASLYAAYDGINSKLQFSLQVEDQSTYESYPITTNVPAYPSSSFPYQVTVGAGAVSNAKCATGLDVIKARYYLENFFSTSLVETSTAITKIFEDDAVKQLAINAPNAALDDSVGYIQDLAQPQNINTILIPDSPNRPDTTQSSLGFGIFTTRDSSCVLTTSTYLCVFTQLDISSAMISIVFQVKDASSNNHQVLLQRYVNSQDEVDFVVGYDISNQVFRIKFNSETKDISSFPPPTTPTLYNIHIYRNIFSQKTDITIIDPLNSNQETITFSSTLSQYGNEVYAIYIGEKIAQQDLCDTGLDAQTTGVYLHNLAISTGQFSLINDTVGNTCAGMNLNKLDCYWCIAGYNINLPNGLCYTDSSCEPSSGTLNVCKSCSEDDACLYCLSDSTPPCHDCLEGYQLDGTANPCQAVSCNDQITNCVACADSDSNKICHKCDTDSYLYNNACVSSCPDGYFANNATTFCEYCPTNCETCSNSTTCTQCLPAYTQLSDLRCQLKTCTSKVQILNMATGNCDNCPDNSYFDATTISCIACASNEEVNADTGACDPCKSNQYYDSVTKACKACNDTDKSWYYNITSVKCQQCPLNSYFDVDATNQCIQCPNANQYFDGASCKNCGDSKQNDYFDLDLNQCTKCATGTYFRLTGGDNFDYDGQQCRPCDDPKNIYDQISDTCIPCGTGKQYEYYSALDGMCSVCGTSSPNDFYNTTSLGCGTCGSALLNSFYNSSTGNCDACNATNLFYSSTDGQCVICGDKTKSNYFSTTDNMCEVCSSLTLYNPAWGLFDYDATACMPCGDPQQFYNSSVDDCTICNAGGLVQNNYFNTSTNSCQLCGTGQVFDYFNTSVLECQTCGASKQFDYLNTTTNSCQICGNGLLTDYYNTSANSCGTCNTTNLFYSPTDGQCVICGDKKMNNYFNATDNMCEVCPSGTIYNPQWSLFDFDSTACVPCGDPQKFYNSTADACSICNAGGLVQNNYFNTSTNLCQICGTGNAFDFFNTSQFECQTCGASQQFDYLNTTTNSCQICGGGNGFDFFNVSNSSCQVCGGGRKIDFLNSTNQCDTCADPNNYYDNTTAQCVACPLYQVYNATYDNCSFCFYNNQHYSTDTKACAACSTKNQVINQTTGDCVSCPKDYQIFNQTLNRCAKCYYNNSHWVDANNDCTVCPQSNQYFNRTNSSCSLCGLNNTYFNISDGAGGQCDTCLNSNEIYNITTNTCTPCGNGRKDYFFNTTLNDCDQCPQSNQKWDPNTKTCIQLCYSSNLIMDSVLGICVSCGPNSFYNASKGLRGDCQTCPTWYQVWNETSNGCDICKPYNMYFDSTTAQCKACSNPNQFFNTSALNTSCNTATCGCQDCTYRNQYFNTTNNNCTSCAFKNQIYVLSPTAGCANCSKTNQIFSTTYNDCYNCSIANAYYNSTVDDCVTCKGNQGYSTDSNSCVNCTYTNQVYNVTSWQCEDCPKSNQFFNSTTGTCTKCSLVQQFYNKTFNGVGGCVACPGGNQRFRNIINACDSCSLGNQFWNETLYNYVLTTNTTPVETSAGCQNCTNKNAFWNTTSLACQSCPAKNQYYNGTACVQYNLNNQYFNETSNSDATCKANEIFNVTACVACNPNAYFDNTTNACKSCSFSNQYYSLAAGACLNCSTNAYYDKTYTTYCRPCPYNNQLYNVSINNTVLIQNCQECSLSNQIYNTTTNSCTSCKGNEYFSKTDNKCSSCSATNQYYNLTNKACTPCGTQNMYFNYTLNNCTRCSGNQKYNNLTVPNGCYNCSDHATFNETINDCVECAINEIIDLTTGKCSLCPYNAFYNITYSNKTCNSCKENEYYDVPTKACKNCSWSYTLNIANRSCDACLKNAYYSNSKCQSCVNSNEIATYFTDNNTVKCTPCNYTNQYFSATANNCVSCKSNQWYSLSNNSCWSCAGNQWYDWNTTVNKCQTCGLNQYWNTAVDPNACTNCASNEYYDTTLGRCKTCQSNCSSCFGSDSNCSTCNTGYFKQKYSYSCRSDCKSDTDGSGSSAITYTNNATNQCVLTGWCPERYYSNITNRACESCDEACLVCSDPTSTNCTKCTSDYYLLQGTKICQARGDILIWHNDTTWADTASQAIPKDGESVNIANDKAILLTGSTAYLDTLVIEGNLQVNTDSDLTIYVKRLYIKAGGSLMIGVTGSDAAVLDVRVHILFYGGTSTASTSLGLNGDLSNLNTRQNVFVNIGEIVMNSTIEDSKTWRSLTDPIAKGAQKISLTGVEEWITSDSDSSNAILVTSSSFDTTSEEFDDVVVDSEGISLTDQSFSSFHYGSDNETTVNTINGNIDMRAHVGVRDRKIKIYSNVSDQPLIFVIGSQKNTTATTTSRRILDSIAISDSTILYGTASMYGVTFMNMGDKNLVYGGVNILGIKSDRNDNIFGSSIVACSIWNSVSPGLILNTSSKFAISGNLIYNTVANSIKVLNSTNYNIYENLLVSNAASTSSSLELPIAFSLEDLNTVFTDSTDQGKVYSNIVTGQTGIAYYAPAGMCDAAQSLKAFYNNVAYSGGIGWLAITNSASCVQVSDFTAYKMQEGVIAYPFNKDLIANNLFLSDNKNSLMVNLGFTGMTKQITVKDSVVSGLGYNDCEDCYSNASECSGVSGMRLSAITSNNISLPLYSISNVSNITTSSIYNPSVIVNNVVFRNFFESLADLTTAATSRLLSDESSESSSTEVATPAVPLTYKPIIASGVTCSNNRIFVANKYSVDYTALHRLQKSTVENVALSSVFQSATSTALTSTYFAGDTGLDNKLSGLYNYLVTDSDGTFFQTLQTSNQVGYQTIIPNNPLPLASSGCQAQTAWNGYFCLPTYAVLVLESVGTEKYNSSITISPVVLISESTQLSNPLTKYSLHKGETGRIPRFTSIVNLNQTYSVEYSGTSPTVMQFKLQGTDAYNWIRLKFPINNSWIVQVAKNGKNVDAFPKTPDGRKDVLTISARTCGTNMVQTDSSYIEIFVTGDNDCLLTLSYLTGVYIKTRIDISLDAFVKVGYSSFITKVASALGIESSRILTYAYSRGSTIVEFAIQKDVTFAQNDDQVAELKFITEKYVNMSSSGQFLFEGKTMLSNTYKIASSSSSGVEVISQQTTTDTPTNTTDTTTNTGSTTSTSTTTTQQTFFQENGVVLMIGIGVAALIVFGIVFYCCIIRKKKVAADDDEVDEDDLIIQKLRVKSGRTATEENSRPSIELSPHQRAPRMVL